MPVSALFRTKQQLLFAPPTAIHAHNNIPLHALTMMAPEYYVFTGERVPNHVTHVLIAKALNFVRARSFEEHPNIQEVICHDGVEKIEAKAFNKCPSLRRVIMPGVKIIEQMAFNTCRALTYIECGKLERIGAVAFQFCKSLSSVDLPSIKIVEGKAFLSCINLINAKFGKDLESIKYKAFFYCRSLERIALPLKDDNMLTDDTFRVCENLYHVDLFGGVHETVTALLIEEWKNDVNEEIDTINQILPNTHAGNVFEGQIGDVGEKAQAIQAWMKSVLHKYTHYTAKHRHYLKVATAALQPALPNDIVLKNVLPFLQLPSDKCEADDDDSEDDNIPLAALRLA